LIDLRELKRQNKRFKRTLLLSYILFTLVVFGALYFVHARYSSSESIQNLHNEIEKEASYKQIFFENFLQVNIDTIKAISQNEIFINFIKERSNKYVNSLFKTIMQSHTNYMQLRFIDKNGQETIRFDRKEIGDKPILIKKNKLQNKFQRYYCIKCLNLNKDEIWLSEIDLNMEYGKIEKPIKPVLRIAHSIYKNNILEGFVIVNIFMKNYIEYLTQSSMFDIYLVDQNGYFLSHINKKYNWSRYFNKNQTVKELNINTNLLKANLEYFDNKNRYFIQPLTHKKYKKYKLIYFENTSKTMATRVLIEKRTIITLIFAILIAVPFAYVASSPATNLYKNLYKKSNEITKLANQLENKVKAEIEKNMYKDKILENQAKLAALGEMLGNIAHQWRHPITRVSLILQNIKTFKSLNKLSDEQLDKYIGNALEQMDYMSQTIDDFKDFYKPDNESSIFNANTAINSAYKIIEASIKHQGIQIYIQNHSDFLIKGYKNQFSQVILNIIHNAKDVLEEKYINSPFIKISLKNKNDKINIITIEDNGGGINPDLINKIFNAYFTTKKGNGTGIGLYMSKMIIEENFKGSIDVTNGLNGAIFTINIPIIKV